MDEKSRSSLILQLSRQNLEVHNIDEPIWAIKNSIMQSPDDLDSTCPESETSNGKMHAVDTEIIESTIFPEALSSKMQTCEDTVQTVNEENPAFIDSSIVSENLAPTPTVETEMIINTDIEQEAGPSGVQDASKFKSSDSGSCDSVSSNSESSDSDSCPSEPYGSGKSDVDPDYKAPLESSESSDNIKAEEKGNQVPQKKGRKRKRDPANWDRNITKNLKNSGLAYESIKITKSHNGIIEKFKVMRPEKKLLPVCNDKCRLKCRNIISEEKRQIIFKEYWNISDLQRQRDYVGSCIKQIQPRYRYQRNNSNRSLNNAFYFEMDQKEIRVCKRFFISTLGITPRTVRTVVEKQKSQAHRFVENEMRGKHGNQKKLPKPIKDGIENHIKSIPRIESHYCRQQIKREYIEGTKTIADLHRDYENSCKEKNEAFGNYQAYYKIFNEDYNIGFFFSKKDQCDLCVEYKNSSNERKFQLQEKYDTHLKEKTMSRIEKERDKTLTEKITVTFDLQATLPCPTGSASSFYYVSKLNVYNLTFYALTSQNVQCYVWHEAEARRGANEIGSCVWHYLNYLEETFNSNKESKMFDIVFYTDNCFGQNKNRFIFCLYMFALTKFKFIKSITHKFLITGHTQNEGDHVHSVIEKQVSRYKKTAPIYVPDQYVSLIRQAKRKEPHYHVKEMIHSDFFDLKDLNIKMGLKNSYRNTDGEIFKISDLKIFRVEKDKPGKFFYKNSYQDEYYYEVDTLSRRTSNDVNFVSLKPVYTHKVGISENKKQGILTLIKKNVVPQFYRQFYENL